MKFFIQTLWRKSHNFAQFLRWFIISSLTGLFVGAISCFFSFCLHGAVEFRLANPWIIFFLPFAGLLIVFLYRLLHYENNAGTDTVIDSIHKKSYIPFRMSVLIFVSTVLTVLCGGSVGREGAAIQIGGSLGEQLGEKLKFNEKDKKIMLMSGIAAAFSALFGTPMAAAFFAMEVASVGVMYYAALVPCIWAALVSYQFALFIHAPSDDFIVSSAPELALSPSLWVVLLAILCAVISILFCLALQEGRILYKKFLPNPYIRIFAGGVFIVILALLLKTRDYLGPGMHIIEDALAGQVVPAAFFLKIIFTALTIGAGFKGGEIVPSFFVGATFGCLFGQITGFSPSLCASVGMVAVFCGVTNCPITSLLISFELFGFDNAYFYLIAIAISYMLSGYYSLYHSQTIVYSKFENTYINTPTSDIHTFLGEDQRKAEESNAQETASSPQSPEDAGTDQK